MLTRRLSSSGAAGATKRRATCWAASDGMLTEVGKQMVMIDGTGHPAQVLETAEVTLRRSKKWMPRSLTVEAEGPDARFLAAGAPRLIQPPRSVRRGQAALVGALPGTRDQTPLSSGLRPRNGGTNSIQRA
jgi:hypothetical protein